MRQYWWKVVFKSGIEDTCLAFSAEEAMILSQARQIRLGRDFTVLSVTKLNDDFGDWDCVDYDYID